MKTTAFISALLCATSTFVTAQEAFVTQVGAVTVTTPVPTRASPTVLNLQAQIAAIAPVPQDARAEFRIDLLPAVPTTSAIAEVQQTGTGHQAGIDQQGLQAALIRQSGANNTAMIQQGGGTLNRAAIIQSSSSGQAQIRQSGSNNMAYIVQN